MRAWLATATVMLVSALAAAPAHAAKSCPEPEGDWPRATPAEAGMDAAKLQDAIDYASTQTSFAVRVYRHGCLVAEDRGAAANRNQTYESWSLAKSVTSLIFGRAMSLGYISPDDPVGSLLPEADGPHGAITMRQLLTMTSGLHWNGFRDYNIFTMQDRVRDALTLPIDHPPGTYFEYAQSAVALLAEAIGRAVDEDVQEFAQRELMDRIGIPEGSWYWLRDSANHVQGFYGVNMRPDDFGRLGEVLRRGGMWKGKRLLAKRYVKEALTATRTNGCYGFLIWLNAAAPCIGPTIQERSVSQDRDWPDFPADMWQYSGLFGQRVTTFPSLGLMVVRTGQDPGVVPAGQANWEHETYRRVLSAVTDQKVEKPPPATGPEEPEHDYGFQTAIAHPEDYGKGVVLFQDPLPPAGPPRARAAIPLQDETRASRTGRVPILLVCPGNWPARSGARCEGDAGLTGATGKLAYSIPAGAKQTLRFVLKAKTFRKLRRTRRTNAKVTTSNGASGGATPGEVTVVVRGPR
ncbi:MAG: beta-lactamase family protein [Actinomycetota bacterium]|nr:beta-lactamase family protein [Actinomycetota bacterium]